MLLNWMTSTLHKHPSMVPTPNLSQSARSVIEDPAIYTSLLQLFCTNLLVAGVIKQIPDQMAPVQNTFRVN